MTYKYIAYRNIEIAFCEQGQGDKTLLLLHGYLEDSTVWNGFLEHLSAEFRVVCIDLLGHGKTGVLGEMHTMTDMAEAVFFVTKYLSIKTFWLLGHSMGGYVTMEFAYRYPNLLEGIVLLHSSAKADTTDKQQARMRTIDLIKQGKRNLVTAEHVPMTFAPENLVRYTERIAELKKTAEATSEKGIIAALLGMRDRIDRTEILRTINRPVLFICGKQDNFIPFPVSKQQFTLSSHIIPLILEHSGHMGFIEEEKTVVKAIVDIIKTN